MSRKNKSHFDTDDFKRKIDEISEKKIKINQIFEKCEVCDVYLICVEDEYRCPKCGMFVEKVNENIDLSKISAIDRRFQYAFYPMDPEEREREREINIGSEFITMNQILRERTGKNIFSDKDISDATDLFIKLTKDKSKRGKGKKALMGVCLEFISKKNSRPFTRDDIKSFVNDDSRTNISLDSETKWFDNNFKQHTMDPLKEAITRNYQLIFGIFNEIDIDKVYNVINHEKIIFKINNISLLTQVIGTIIILFNLHDSIGEICKKTAMKENTLKKFISAVDRNFVLKYRKSIKE